MKFGGTMETYVSIYPVGVVDHAQQCLRIHLKHPEARHLFRPRLFVRHVRRNWKRRSYWNGFLCEPYELPDNMNRCGSGLTPGRAYANYMELWRESRRSRMVKP